MPKLVPEKINRFLGGLTTDLRTNFEVPKFARMWNFKAEGDVLTQRYGLVNLSPNQGHVLVGEDLSVPQTTQNTTLNHIGYVLHNNGAGVMLDTYEIQNTPSLTGTVNVNPGFSVNFGIVPAFYQNGIAYHASAPNSVWWTDLTTSTQLLIIDSYGNPINFDKKTFFVSHTQDGRLYVGSGGAVHTVEIYPAGSRTCTVDEQVEFTQGKEVTESEGLALTDAKIVVGGGRGLGAPEGFEDMKNLAAAIGKDKAAVGASRAAVDLGWFPPSEQIGLTGKVVTPDLYIAIAVSGASQHMAGCSGSKMIVAVNRDKDANIFAFSKYGIVGDWKQVVPALIEEFKKG